MILYEGGKATVEISGVRIDEAKTWLIAHANVYSIVAIYEESVEEAERRAIVPTNV